MEMFGVHIVWLQSGEGSVPCSFPSLTYLQAYAKGGETRRHTAVSLFTHTHSRAHTEHTHTKKTSRDERCAFSPSTGLLGDQFHQQKTDLRSGYADSTLEIIHLTNTVLKFTSILLLYHKMLVSS